LLFERLLPFLGAASPQEGAAGWPQTRAPPCFLPQRPSWLRNINAALGIDGATGVPAGGSRTWTKPRAPSELKSVQRSCLRSNP
jgi:hypothetical protein